MLPDQAKEGSLLKIIGNAFFFNFQTIESIVFFLFLVSYYFKQRFLTIIRYSYMISFKNVFPYEYDPKNI